MRADQKQLFFTEYDFDGYFFREREIIEEKEVTGVLFLLL